MKSHANLAIFVPHQGCPKDCVFCNQSRITGAKRLHRYSESEVRSLIEQGLSTIKQGQTVEIAFFGGSFTGLPRSYQRMLLSVAQSYLLSGQVHGIRLSTRPDYITSHIMDFLLSYGVTTIELGCQSLDPEVLLLSKRGHTVAQVEKAVSCIRKYPVQLGLQLLPGLPGDTREKSVETARKTVALGPDFVRIYPALVIEETELASLYRKGLYHPLTLEESVIVVAEMWLEFLQANIPVIRMGLHPSEDLRTPGTILAGPFHPSFRQLVEEELYRRLLKRMMEEIKGAGSYHHVEVWIHPADETSLRGRGGQNLRQAERENSCQILVRLDAGCLRRKIQWRLSDGKQGTLAFTDLIDKLANPCPFQE